MTDSQKIQNIWQERFNLAEDEADLTPEQQQVIAQVKKYKRNKNHEEDSLNRIFSQSDLESCLPKQKNGKQPGTDLLCNEALKNGGQTLGIALLMLFNFIWHFEIIPSNWKTAIMNPRYKKTQGQTYKTTDQ